MRRTSSSLTSVKGIAPRLVVPLNLIFPAYAAVVREAGLAVVGCEGSLGVSAKRNRRCGKSARIASAKRFFGVRVPIDAPGLFGAFRVELGVGLGTGFFEQHLR